MGKKYPTTKEKGVGGTLLPRSKPQRGTIDKVVKLLLQCDKIKGKGGGEDITTKGKKTPKRGKRGC